MPSSDKSVATKPNNIQPYQNVTIIGNGQGEWQPTTEGHNFVFNATQHQAPNVINICNGPYAESSHAFVVNNSPDNDQLVSLLTQVADTLNQQLNCWPSSGLVTSFLMTMVASQVSVQRMSLMPKLSRSSSLPADEHLPCMVHNWLGERRLALGLTLTHNTIVWPELLIDQASIPAELDTRVEQPDINPFEVLLSDYVRRSKLDNQPAFSLATAQSLALQVTTERPVQVDLQYALLAALSNLPSVHWLSYATQDDLITAEALFYNEYPQTQASYWYLVDYQASQFLDNIRHHLAYCQQVFALTAKPTTENK
ncbi:hypothetical protein [Shewanella ulleungensis]|uniref:Uncharacterized protein n=1 Tax=Shewanella ulleungensis TaxID=2282699 RepID=A0ABQ2QEA1_9GAMM|nr:hypothetical protein [Shewanella ulleungensis]MCL1148707.1 hypothetical protein [Shewanella ulleungensis]GGP76085.1 hypothetical protein GCM10009410_05560 [Shewanella ulleungensis]